MDHERDFASCQFTANVYFHMHTSIFIVVRDVLARAAYFNLKIVVMLQFWNSFIFKIISY